MFPGDQVLRNRCLWPADHDCFMSVRLHWSWCSSGGTIKLIPMLYLVRMSKERAVHVPLLSFSASALALAPASASEAGLLWLLGIFSVPSLAWYHTQEQGVVEESRDTENQMLACLTSSIKKAKGSLFLTIN